MRTLLDADLPDLTSFPLSGLILTRYEQPFAAACFNRHGKKQLQKRNVHLPTQRKRV